MIAWLEQRRTVASKKRAVDRAHKAIVVARHSFAARACALFGSMRGMTWAFATGTAVGAAVSRGPTRRAGLMSRVLAAAMWVGHAERLVGGLHRLTTATDEARPAGESRQATSLVGE